MIKKVFFRIVTFYVIAIVFSSIFRFQLFGLDELEAKLPMEIVAISAPLQSLGVFLGAIISIFLLKKVIQTDYSFLGTSPLLSIIMLAFPVILLTVTGVENTAKINSHLFGFLSGMGTLFYCYFEETGWRGYLQEELKKTKEWLRVLIIGSLWFFWHLNFIDNPGWLLNLQFWGILILSSWGLGKIIELTKSVAATTSFHMVVNIIVMNYLTRNGLQGKEKLIILGVSFVAGVIIIIIWNKKHQPDKQAT